MADQHPKVVVIMSRCRTTGGNFGIRAEVRRESLWIANWAFAISAESSKREGYDRTTIRGEFELEPMYPGCPYCSSSSFFQCSCGRIGCWDQSERVTCPWCKESIQVSGRIESLEAGSDR
jgi:TerY-C metal binding domain